MLLAVYNVYADSIRFIRRNIFVVVPYIFYSILNSALSIWVSEGSLLGRWIQSIESLLFILFLEVFSVIYVYKREKIIVTEESVLQTINLFSGGILLLLAYYIVFSLLSVFVLILIFQKTPVIEKLIMIPVVFILAGSYPLSLRHLIYFNNTIVMDSIKAGVRELFKNFLIYFLVVLIGILLSRLLSLMKSFAWISWPFLPIAKYFNIGSGTEFDWFQLLLTPILLSLASVTLTYAFILKNGNTKHKLS